MQRTAVQPLRPEARKISYQERLAWAQPRSNYQRMEDFEIEQENRRILAALRQLNQEVTMELAKCVQRAANSPQRDASAEQVLLDEHAKNNSKAVEHLMKELKVVQQRKQQLLSGREEQTADEKYRVADSIAEKRAEVKQLKLEIKQLQKDLVQNQHRDVPYCQQLVEKLEEQLRVCSSKYTNYLKRYRISEDQLLSIVPAPPVYLNTGSLDMLEKREAEQYKEYLNIVKLSEILSHRNESDLSKYSRQYGQKIKQLESLMSKLSDVEGHLASRQLEALQTKKQVEIMKLKVAETTHQPIRETPGIAMRRNSHSVKNIIAPYDQRIAQLDQQLQAQRRSTNKISNTERYMKRIFPTRKRTTPHTQNFFQLQPIKAKLRTANIPTIQQTH